MNRSALFLQFFRRSVDVVDADIGHPGGFDAILGGLFGNFHETGDTLTVDREDRVARVANSGILRAPADHFAIEARRSLGVGGHHVVPEELSLHRALRCWPGIQFDKLR